MDEIWVENFRCFRERQKARLAPLTLLVGENSTGKTSLMAMIRVLCEAVLFGQKRPGFNAHPYELGSFREIVHQGGEHMGRATSFSAGFGDPETSDNAGKWRCAATFEQGRHGPEVCKLRFENAIASIEWRGATIDSAKIYGTTARGRWRIDGGKSDGSALKSALSDQEWDILSFGYLRKHIFIPIDGSPPVASQDRSVLENLVFAPHRRQMDEEGDGDLSDRPLATAPVRSRPHRTYNPDRTVFLDPDGAVLPSYLAAVSRLGGRYWSTLIENLNAYGKLAGVFDEIRIRPLGETDGDPFQVQVKIHVGQSEGRWRNLVDVGYGVSQILPILVLSFHPESPEMLLLQQPEAHLHPSAQAALGSILCEQARSGRQLIVETHSDHLIDRVRMDARDGKTGLAPDDVSILFFERKRQDVRIHNLGIDQEGNVLNAPASYRQFFTEEVSRSLGL